MASQRRLLESLEQAVHQCRPLALRYFQSKSLRVEHKADRSPVTAADRAIEERLRRALARIAPGEPILGEEFGASGQLSDTYWTIDPIDGTRAFSRGLPSWGIMVGRVEQGQARLGLVDFPAIGVTIGVATGVPAYEQTGGGQSRLPSARPLASLASAVIFHGGVRWWPARAVSGMTILMKACYLERAYGDCYGYLWALTGLADAVIDYGVKPWDMVPLAALAEATGRRMTDFSGHDSFTGPETIMGHASMVRLISQQLHGRGQPKT